MFRIQLSLHFFLTFWIIVVTSSLQITMEFFPKGNGNSSINFDKSLKHEFDSIILASCWHCGRILVAFLSLYVANFLVRTFRETQIVMYFSGDVINNKNEYTLQI